MENQNTEWKETWRDEFLKAICAFANAQGGTLEIGRDDAGRIVGVTGAQRLLQDVPNKIRNAMGILADVELTHTNGLDVIRIAVKAHPFPISYRGKYYYRSGSTTQELNGYALDEFLLRKQGKTWDGVPIPHVSAKNLDPSALQEFREKALISKRLSDADLRMSDAKLIDKLMLTESGYLKRAAVLLFHPNPEKWVLGASVKIGYFENDADLKYQDEISGPLMFMPDRVLEILYAKYFKGIISYQGIQRVETFPVARDALREAVLNAVVHRDYSTGNPVHIKIYEDKVLIFNDGKLPDDWTVEDLLRTHTSKPYNPFIAKAFFRSGMIETWGRGIERMISACLREGKPAPFYNVKPYDIMIGFYTTTSNTHGGASGGVNISLGEIHLKILEILRETPTISALKVGEALGISKRRAEYTIGRLKKLGLVERSGPDKKGKWLVR
jgi:ATP-dependent DNA helicase RecG